MVKARKYILKKIFDGLPKRDDYEIVEYELPALKNGEILVKAEWISVDPYQRIYLGSVKLPYDQFGYQVGIVEETKNPKFPVGSRVVSHNGWCTYSVIDATTPNEDSNLDPRKAYKLPDLLGLSPSLGVGAIGMPGVTAYFGFLEICQPKVGETVVVSGAAGAVGSLVGQIAKIKGCKVIGFAGSDDKVQWLEKELGFDKAINYKNLDIKTALKEAAPEGVDCYFDNVGGEISSIIMSQMNVCGRVAVCGSISAYIDDPAKLPKATVVQISILSKRLKVEGFWASNWADRWFEALTQLTQWIKSGKLKAREHVTEGFENLVDAFIGVLTGDNFGKAVVKV